MRRLVFTGTLLAALAPATAVLASTPPGTEPVPVSTDVTSTPGTEMVGSTATMPTETATIGTETAPTATAVSPATIYNDNGDAVATVTVSSIEPSWGDYSTDNAPDEGKEYVRATVTVQSMQTDGTFSVATDNFILQDNNGFVTTAETVLSTEQDASGEDVTSDADLANGESVELELTFQVAANVGPQSIFYRPSDDVLVDIAEIS